MVSKKVFNDILELVGNTPIVKLNKIPKEEGVKATILTKLEFYNPGGSVKDRVALAMILDAEKKGKLKKGDTIVEATSGNTGIGLALIGAVRGYNVIIVAHNKISEEKKKIIEALGAEVIVTSTKDYRVKARKIAKQKGAFIPDQYNNPYNPVAHYKTAYEIWDQTDGLITDFVAGMGTGGTITGVGKALKNINKNIKIIGIDPEGSIYDNVTTYPTWYEIEGIGESKKIPGVFDKSAVDMIIKVKDKDAFLMCRRLAREEGLLCGGSSGAAVYGAIKYAEEYNLDENRIIVVLIPDSGERYLTKIYSDEWMKLREYL